jgi:hypothetical protein
MSEELKKHIRKIVREKISEVVVTNEAHKEFVPYGSDVSSGTYKCVDCGYIYSNQSKKSLPPCPMRNEVAHEKNGWKILTGRGDAVDDPYPGKN